MRWTRHTTLPTRATPTSARPTPSRRRSLASRLASKAWLSRSWPSSTSTMGNRGQRCAGVWARGLCAFRAAIPDIRMPRETDSLTPCVPILDHVLAERNNRSVAGVDHTLSHAILSSEARDEVVLCGELGGWCYKRKKRFQTTFSRSFVFKDDLNSLKRLRPITWSMSSNRDASAGLVLAVAGM